MCSFLQHKAFETWDGRSERMGADRNVDIKAPSFPALYGLLYTRL